jgi:hypothetical protein
MCFKIARGVKMQIPGFDYILPYLQRRLGNTNLLAAPLVILVNMGLGIVLISIRCTETGYNTVK